MEAEIEIMRIGSRSFLRINDVSIEVKNYKISSSMHGGTELEVTIELASEFTEFTEFSTKANSKQH